MIESRKAKDAKIQKGRPASIGRYMEVHGLVGFVYWFAYKV